MLLVNQVTDQIEEGLLSDISKTEAELAAQKAELAQYRKTKKKYLPRPIAAIPSVRIVGEKTPSTNGHRNGDAPIPDEIFSFESAPDSPITKFSDGTFNLSATINKLINGYATDRQFDKDDVVAHIRRLNPNSISDDQVQTVSSHIWKLAKNNFLEIVSRGKARQPSTYRRIAPINFPSKKRSAKTNSSMVHHT